jgi:hypothetical protein
MLGNEGSALGTYSHAIVRPTFQPQQLQYQPAPYPQHLQPYGQPVKPSVWDTYRGMFTPPQQANTTPVESAVTGLRHVGEGAAIAALLAFAQRQFGTLDVRGKYPVDGILAGLAFAMSVKEASKPNGYAADLRAISQSAATIYTYRKILGDGGNSKSVAAGESAYTAAPATIPNIPRNIRNSDSNDPILAAARAAGF